MMLFPSMSDNVGNLSTTLLCVLVLYFCLPLASISLGSMQQDLLTNLCEQAYAGRNIA